MVELEMPWRSLTEHERSELVDLALIIFNLTQGYPNPGTSETSWLVKRYLQIKERQRQC